jgi:pyruvate/2-oxoglutarate dehydrogenase complex dihydrolipoamide acyltransferase (E2) component
MAWFLWLPAFLRRVFYWAIRRFPQLLPSFSSSVMVTAVGMFGRGGGWAITVPNHTTSVAVGGIVEKPGVLNGEIAIRQYLNLTVSLDHDIVDGAPAARFAQQFRELLESGHGLE